jgi:hypothetical protein
MKFDISRHTKKKSTEKVAINKCVLGREEKCT